MRGMARLSSVTACAVGLAACSDSTSGEFPPAAHGTIQGIVVGTQGQPLDAVLVTLLDPVGVGGQYSFGFPGYTTGSDGRFSLPVTIKEPVEGTTIPDEFDVYVRGTAEPPKYPAPPGKENTTDSVLVTARLKPRDEPPPVVSATLQLPILE
jgi:hypothetical protein